MKIYVLFLIVALQCNLSYSKSLDEMDANTSPDITNDLIYSQDVSDTSEASTGTGKSLTIKNLLKAGKITVDGTNVGINSINPTQRLDVVGTVLATAFVGDGSGLTGLASSNVTINTTSPMTGSGTGSSFTLGVDQSKLTLSSIGGAVTDAQVPNNITITNLSGTNTGDQTTISGNAGTATALAANGTNCSAGNYPLGVDASGNVEDCTLAGSGSVGIGTANTITFWPTTSTIGSLPTATYPSLTELSYVKDVTSAIQTQLNAKDAVTTAGDFITRTANDFDVDALDEDDMTSNSAVHLATQQSIKAYVDTAISGVSGGAGGWTDGGTNVYLTATTDNVGIGTTTPSTTLEIVKQSSQVPLMVSSTATGDGDYLIVRSSGNIGIGSTVPGNILTVRGATSASIQAINSSASGSSAGGGIQMMSDDNAAVVLGDRLGNFTFGGSADTADTILNGGAISGYADGTWSGSSAPTEVRIEVAPSGSTTRAVALVADSTSNIGIGTTTPQTKLQVVGAVTATSFSGDGSALTGISAGGWTDGGASITTTTTTDTVGIGTTTVADGILQIGGDNVTIGIGGTNNNATAAGELYVKGDLEVDGTIYGDGSQLTGIAAGGWVDGGTNVYVSPTTDNVGIGTTTPSTNFKADVRGNLYVSGNVGIGTLLPRGTLDLGPTGTVYAQTFTGPTGPTILGTSNNVGIGTITAGSLLTVGSTGQVTVSSAGAIATSSTVSVADDAYAAGWNASTAVPTKNAVYDKIETLGSGGWTDGSAAVYPTTSTDNVGIGTVSPGKKLDLYGTDSDIRMNSTDTAQFTGFQFYNGTTQVGEFGAGGSTTSTPNQIFLEHVVPNAPIDFINDTGIQLRIKGPNVGIGTTGSGGAIFVSPDGSCSKCGPNNADVWACASVTCL